MTTCKDIKFIRHGVSLSLVPDEISIYFEVTGCALRCKGCHTPEMREDIGEVLTPDLLREILDRYHGRAGAAVFLGGDHAEVKLSSLLAICKEAGYETCLYTGNTIISKGLTSQLTYLKIGPYVERRGGLESDTTNQKFIDLRNNKDITYKFRRT